MHGTPRKSDERFYSSTLKDTQNNNHPSLVARGAEEESIMTGLRDRQRVRRTESNSIAFAYLVVPIGRFEYGSVGLDPRTR
jgi:hypothetical protein